MNHPTTVDPTEVLAAQHNHAPRVLCVDDDPDIPRSIARILAQYDVEVLTAYYGQQGIWETVQQHPDLVITDVMMPRGDGENLTNCLKQNQRTAPIPIIVLTGLRGRKLRMAMCSLGAERVLTKPIHPQELICEIGRYIPLRKKAAEH